MRSTVHEEMQHEVRPLAAASVAPGHRRETRDVRVQRRPRATGTATPLENLHLAGDYTASDYPATLEAAVRSGIAAAKRVLGERFRGRAPVTGTTERFEPFERV